VYSPVSFGEYGKIIVGMSLVPRPHDTSRISEVTWVLSIESGGANCSTATYPPVSFGEYGKDGSLENTGGATSMNSAPSDVVMTA